MLTGATIAEWNLHVQRHNTSEHQVLRGNGGLFPSCPASGLSESIWLNMIGSWRETKGTLIQNGASYVIHVITQRLTFQEKHQHMDMCWPLCAQPWPHGQADKASPGAWREQEALGEWRKAEDGQAREKGGDTILH